MAKAKGGPPSARAHVKPRRKIGGPPKREPKPGERVALSLRMTPDLKRRLDYAADQGGRSQSQEAEIRLQQSFDREDLLPQVMALACGSREVGGIATMVALTLCLGARYGYPFALDGPPPDESRLAEWQKNGGTWLTHPRAFDDATMAVVTLLNAFRPDGAHPVHVLGLDPSYWGVANAKAVIRAVRGDDAKTYPLPVEAIRNLLGPLTKRLAKADVGLPAIYRGPLVIANKAAILSIADAVLDLINSSPRLPSREKVGEVVMAQLEALSEGPREATTGSDLPELIRANEVYGMGIAEAILTKINTSPRLPTREEIGEVVLRQMNRITTEQVHADWDRIK